MALPKKTKAVSASKLFDCDNISAFDESIIRVLPFNGASMSRFYECEIGDVLFLTKLCFYRKTASELYGVSSKDVVSHADAEINILRALQKKIVNKNISPCIIELVYWKICNATAISKKWSNCTSVINYEEQGSDLQYSLCKYADLVKSDMAHNKCAFLVLDMCDISFDMFLRRNTYSSMTGAIFRSILFQIIYTLYAIQCIYPGFRHYDLHTENIMLKFDNNYEFRADSPKYLCYVVGKKKHYVPYFGIVPKIIDFGFSVLPEEGIISNAIEDKYRMYYRTNNDVLFLFHWIYNTVAQAGGEYMESIVEILYQLDPLHSFSHYNTDYIRKNDDKVPTYKEMLANSLWKGYRTTKATNNQIYKKFTAPK